MGRFAFIAYCYTAYLCVLIAGNTASLIMHEPVLALGYISKWWVVVSIFLLTYLSEWAEIVYQKQ